MNKIYGNINSVETMGLVDGPGIRYVVFMQGCKLRCLYCHNPETWDIQKNVQKITPEKLIENILRYKNYFGESGGVTFSGGEPLLQPEFLIECLKLCKKYNINSAIDTAGVGIGHYEEILELVDLVILDIKASDESNYKKITGKDMSEFNRFLSVLNTKKCKVWIRQVIVPKLNDNTQNIESLKNFISTIKNVDNVELLPYKTFGVHKYKDLKIPYRLENIPEMSDFELKKLQDILLKVNNIKQN